MKKEKTIKGAELLGVKVKQDKNLDKYRGVVLFPSKLKKANEIISKIKLPE
jgi:hypothetical protein